MNNETTTPAKRGRKRIGNAPMSSTERARRTRERQEASGIKVFSMQVQGLHLEYVEKRAFLQEISASAALRLILEPALDRYVGLMRRCERMLANGATPEQAAEFMQAHWMPELPPMPSEGAVEK